MSEPVILVDGYGNRFVKVPIREYEELAGRAVQDDGLDVERLRRYEDHVGGLHCPEWHAETCEWQVRCDEPGCKREVTCGFPTDTGYRQTCSEHYRTASPLNSSPENPPQKFLADSPNDEG